MLSGIEAVHRSQSFLDSLAEQMAGGNHVAIDGDKVRLGDSEGNGWPDPHPLAAKIEPEPYPLDALPLPIRAAVEEVAGFVKAPVPMVASSALAALSLAMPSAHADAKRAEKLHGPVGLFLLTIADSGERKSTCDGFFTSSIGEYQEAQAEAAKPAIKESSGGDRCMGSQARRRQGKSASLPKNRQIDCGHGIGLARTGTRKAGTAKSAPADTMRMQPRKHLPMEPGEAMAVGWRGICRGRGGFRFAWHGQGLRHAESGLAESAMGRGA